MKNKNKNLIALSILTFTVAGLFMNSLGIFTSRTATDSFVKVGTLDIAVEIDQETGLTNKDSINPGDNDPNVLADDSIIGKGMDHDFSFKVINEGSKAVRTRHTIILSAENNGELLDAEHLGLFDDNNKELSEKEYVYEGDFISTELLQGYKVVAIKYTYTSDPLSGNGPDAESAGEGVLSTRDYKYNFGLLTTADNNYQGATISFKVYAEAIQFENTTNFSWADHSNIEVEIVNGEASLLAVPAANEDSQGNIID